MSQLGRYVGRTVSWMILLCSLVLFGILTLFTLLDEMTRLENNYQLINALSFVAYTSPRRIYEIIPYGTLMGCLAGLGLLASNSELVIMRSSGVSTYQISFNVMKPVLIILLLNMYLGEYLVPEMEKIARNDRERAISDENKILPKAGFWYREGNVYMHFDWMGSGGVLEGVSHYVFDENRQLVRTLFAKRAVFHNIGKHRSYWLLEDLIATDISKDDISTQRIPSYEWKTNIRPDLLSNEMLVQPGNLSISELKRKIKYLGEQELSTSKYELGYWQKVLQPLSTIGLVFVAISFIFGPLRESSMGVRIVTGMVVGILFKFSQDLMSPASLVFSFPPVLAVLVPILGCFILGYFLFRRAA